MFAGAWNSTMLLPWLTGWKTPYVCWISLRTQNLANFPSCLANCFHSIREKMLDWKITPFQMSLVLLLHFHNPGEVHWSSNVIFQWRGDDCLCKARSNLEEWRLLDTFCATNTRLLLVHSFYAFPFDLALSSAPLLPRNEWGASTLPPNWSFHLHQMKKPFITSKSVLLSLMWVFIFIIEKAISLNLMLMYGCSLLSSHARLTDADRKLLMELCIASFDEGENFIVAIANMRNEFLD